MKRQHITSLAIVTMSALAMVTLAAQDRFTLKSPNGIAFSEYKGYEAWQVIATSQPDDAGGCGTSKTGCMKVILGNSVMIKRTTTAFLPTANPFPTAP